MTIVGLACIVDIFKNGVNTRVPLINFIINLPLCIMITAVTIFVSPFITVVAMCILYACIALTAVGPFATVVWLFADDPGDAGTVALAWICTILVISAAHKINERSHGQFFKSILR